MPGEQDELCMCCRRWPIEKPYPGLLSLPPRFCSIWRSSPRNRFICHWWKARTRLPGGASFDRAIRSMDWMRFLLFTADRRNPFLPTSWKPWNESGICTENRNTWEFFQAPGISVSGHGGQLCGESEKRRYGDEDKTLGEIHQYNLSVFIPCRNDCGGYFGET